MKLQQFTERPFTLALSSGFFGFYAHVGFLKALNEIGLKPASYAGTSAGAIVGAAAARGLTIAEIEKLISGVSRKEFWDPTPGLGFLRGRKLQELLEKEIGTDFRELEKPLRIPVFEIATRSTKVFTAGNLARVVRASSAVPLMFHPVRIDHRLYWDGGIKDKRGIHGISEDELILSHFLEGYAREDQSVKKRLDNYVQVELKGLPSAHPFSMNRGSEIIKAAYQKSIMLMRKSIK